MVYMKKILIATSNAHKVKEVKDIFDSLNFDVELFTPKDLDPSNHNEPVEDGNSFKENSYIKAKFYYDLYHMPTIADDSGICIDFYDGKPGIYSARWLKELSYKEKNIKITNELRGSKNKGAQFVCGITYIDNEQTLYFEGILKGSIADKPCGEEGFGYDPIFIIDGQTKTTAQLGEDFKKYNSHRALALGKLVDYFEK